MLDDKIFEISFMNFGVIVRRKTLIKSLIFVVSVIALFFVLNKQSEAGLVDEAQNPNLELTWTRFIQECGGGETNHRSVYNFE